MDGFRCNSCGQFHDHLPLGYGIPTPIYWSDEVSDHQDSILGTDTCIINGEHFFIRGNVEIPIHDSEELFAYTVWISLSPPSYE